MTEIPTASDLMNKDVTTIRPDSTVLEAAKVMAGKQVGSLVVVRGRTPLGIVTERDVLVKVVAKRKDASTTKVSEVMSSPLITVEPWRPVREAAKIMLDHNIRRLVVLEKGELAGIITIRDITRSIILTMAGLGEEEVLKVEGDILEFET